MDIDIDPVSDVPLYQQLRDRIVEAIADGRLAPGDALASVRQVAANFGINVATVSKGYDMLRHEGFVATHRRSGTVIARGPHTTPAPEGFVEGWLPRLTTLLAEAYAQGLPPEAITTFTQDVLTRLDAAESRERTGP